MPPRRYAAVRWAMDEWVEEHGWDVVEAIVVCTLVVSLAAGLARY